MNEIGGISAPLTINYLKCFVCDKNTHWVNDEKDNNKLLINACTKYTKTKIISKICSLIGNSFVLIANESDVLCSHCFSLFNQIDELEMKLEKLQTVVTDHISKNYGLLIEETPVCKTQECDSKNLADEETSRFNSGVEKALPKTKHQSNVVMSQKNQFGVCVNQVCNDKEICDRNKDYKEVELLSEAQNLISVNIGNNLVSLNNRSTTSDSEIHYNNDMFKCEKCDNWVKKYCIPCKNIIKPHVMNSNECFTTLSCSEKNNVENKTGQIRNSQIKITNNWKLTDKTRLQTKNNKIYSEEISNNLNEFLQLQNSTNSFKSDFVNSSISVQKNNSNNVCDVKKTTDNVKLSHTSSNCNSKVNFNSNNNDLLDYLVGSRKINISNDIGMSSNVVKVPLDKVELSENNEMENFSIINSNTTSQLSSYNNISQSGNIDLSQSNNNINTISSSPTDTVLERINNNDILCNNIMQDIECSKVITNNINVDDNDKSKSLCLQSIIGIINDNSVILKNISANIFNDTVNHNEKDTTDSLLNVNAVKKISDTDNFVTDNASDNYSNNVITSLSLDGSDINKNNLLSKCVEDIFEKSDNSDNCNNFSDESNNEFACLHCDTRFNSVINFEMHNRKFHTEEVNINSICKKPSFDCFICNCNFKNIVLLNLHFKQKHKDFNDNYCHYCDLNFYNDRNNLINHIKSNHVSQKLCTICGKSFKRKLSFINHINYVHNRDCNNLICIHCNKSFNDIKTLINHEKNHSNNYICDICNRTLKTLSGLKVHKMLHSQNYPFICEFCGKGFVSRRALSEHKNNHIQESRYVCDVCGKEYRLYDTYNKHRKLHDNPYPKQCDICKEFFRSSTRLAEHKRRKHTLERPYKCSYCPLSFHISNLLKYHLISIHTKQYPYTCSICNKGYITRNKHARHMSKKHKDDSFINNRLPNNKEKWEEWMKFSRNC